MGAMRAIITDFDRTLLRTDKSVSEYTCSVLKKCREKGFLIMAATARPERAVSDYCELIEFDALVTLNGARIILPDAVIENTIPHSTVKRILKKVWAIPDLILSLETGDGIYSNIPIPEWNAKVFLNFPGLPTESAIYKLLLSSKNDITAEVKKSLTSDTYMTVANGDLIQIMSTEATKWKGIMAMLKNAGVSHKNAVYFGDDNDDIEPIKNCGTGVAVANAVSEVLKSADDVTQSNDEDGVAHYIEKILLNEPLCAIL